MKTWYIIIRIKIILVNVLLLKPDLAINNDKLDDNNDYYYDQVVVILKITY